MHPLLKLDSLVGRSPHLWEIVVYQQYGWSCSVEFNLYFPAVNGFDILAGCFKTLVVAETYANVFGLVVTVLCLSTAFAMTLSLQWFVLGHGPSKKAVWCSLRRWVRSQHLGREQPRYCQR